eukprot:1391222-Pyramimonas_sp.AAC.1
MQACNRKDHERITDGGDSLRRPRLFGGLDSGHVGPGSSCRQLLVSKLALVPRLGSAAGSLFASLRVALRGLLA